MIKIVKHRKTCKNGKFGKNTLMFEKWENGTFWNFREQVFLENGKMENVGILDFFFWKMGKWKILEFWEQSFFFEKWKNGRNLNFGKTVFLKNEKMRFLDLWGEKFC